MTRRISVTTVFLISGATLSFEILLVRAFAIQYVSHFAFMAIGVAMLGTGVAGVVLTLVGRIEVSRAEHWFAIASLLTAVALVASPALVDCIALDPTQLLWDRGQWSRLGLMYALLAVPFAMGAAVVVLALMLEPDRAGVVYGASFLGAAMGAILSLVVSTVAMPDRALATPALLACAAAIALIGTKRGTGRTVLRVATLANAAVALFVVARPPWHVDVSPHKAMPQIEAFPDAERLATRPSPAGWVAAVRAPAFRYAPGLSLAYRGVVPSQVALFVDGGLVGAALPQSEPGDLYEWLPSAAAHALGARHQVLVLGAGGGSDVQSALRHGAGRVVAVEPHRGIAKLAQDVDGHTQGDARTEWVTNDVRSFVAGTPERFDLVTLEPSGAPGGNAGGVHSLNEDFEHTAEAYKAYLRVLRPGGVVTLTRWLSVPPRDAARTILTAGRALRATGSDPRSSMLILRSWATVTVLMKREPFITAEVDAVRAWAESRQFDFDWHPLITAPESRFNFLENEDLYRVAQATASGEAQAEEFAANYPFDVTPISDRRPYPNHFLRIRTLPTLVRAGPGTALPFAELGLLAVVATLVQSIILGALLMLIPVTVGAMRRRRFVPPRLILYFSAIGIAYMVAEIAALQPLTLLLGQVQYAVTVVLAAFLIGSGIGSVWSDHVAPGRLGPIAAILALILIAYALLLLPVVHSVHAAPFFVRAVLALMLVLPAAVLMGFPFPLGLRRLTGADRSLCAWAWAGNGFASVVATPLAALIALQLGFSTLLLVGAGAYGVAGILIALER